MTNNNYFSLEQPLESLFKALQVVVDNPNEYELDLDENDHFLVISKNKVSQKSHLVTQRMLLLLEDSLVLNSIKQKKHLELSEKYLNLINDKQNKVDHIIKRIALTLNRNDEKIISKKGLFLPQTFRTLLR